MSTDDQVNEGGAFGGKTGASPGSSNEGAGGRATEPLRPIHDDATVAPTQHIDFEAAPQSIGTAAGPVTDPGEFTRAIVEVGLIDPEELKAIVGDSTQDVTDLAGVLVKAGKLTAYQAAALYQGKSRGLLIGNYLILGKLGAGGMGVVFKARHRKLGRVVALKILPPSFARDRTVVSRFKREVEAAGRLKHPNIVAALDADEDRGVHFLVMEYVEGRDLAHVVHQRGPLPVKEAIDFLIQAARGLEAAHAEGIVHRDIKPANLMLDTAGTVRVLDLGLARLVDSSNPFGQAAGGRLTESGMYMGTVDYMAPEQAEDSRRADHRADIYSLGCSLYYLMTGREPFVGDTVLRRLMAHQERPAPPLRAARPDAPSALEETFQQMMAKRPADRPESMTAVIALLESCKAAAAAAPAPAVEAPKSSAKLMVFDEAAIKRAGPAKSGRESSIFAHRDESEGVQMGSELSLEDLVMDVRSEVPLAPMPAPTIKRAVKPPAPLPRGTATSKSRPPRRISHAAVVLAAGALALLSAAFVRFVVFPGPTETQFSTPPDSSRDASGGVADARGGGNKVEEGPRIPEVQQVVQTIFDGKSAKGWMLTNRKPLPPHRVQPDGLNPHGAGSYFVLYEKKLSDFVLDFEYKLSKGCNSGVFLRVGDLSDPVNTGIEVALDDTTGTSYVDPGAFYDLVAPNTNAQKPVGEWNRMTITAAGPVLAVSLNGKDVSRINLDEWTVAGKRPDGTDHKFKNRPIADLPRTGYVGFQDHGSDCWFKNITLKTPGSPSTRSGVDRLAGAGSPAISPANPPGPEPEPYVEVGRITGHDHSNVEQVHLLADGMTLLTTSMDRTARLWDLATGREVRRLWHPNGLRAAAVLPDGHRAVTGCADGWVRLWDLRTGHEEKSLAMHNGTVWAVAVSPDGQLALSGGNDETLRLSDVQKGWELSRFEGQASRVWSVAFSPDGIHVLSGAGDGLVRLGDRTKGDALKVLGRHGSAAWVWGVAFSPDGRRAVSGATDGVLILWDIAKLREERRHTVAGGPVRCVAFGPDGRRVIYGTVKGTVGVWDLASGAASRETPSTAELGGIAILPNGGLATVEFDGVVRIWRASRSLERARALHAGGHDADALAEYSKLLADRPDDARLLIERGRLLFELGRSSEADADYAHAARLAPDNPQLFLDTAGWWVAGPYPPDLKTPASIESDPAPDPSKAPPPSGGEPRHWQHVSTGMRGLVNLRKVFDSDDVAAYAMAIVHCASQHEVVLPIGTDDSARFWVNGSLLIEAPRFAYPYWWLGHVTLRPGRNTILAKVVNEKSAFSLNLRISDAPSDFARAHAYEQRWKDAADDYARALIRDPSSRDLDLHQNGGTAFANLARWKEAATAFERAVALDPGNLERRHSLAKAYLASKNLASFRRACKDVLDRFGESKNLGIANAAAWMAALAPEALSKSDYDRAIRIGKKLLDDKKVGWVYLNTYGALLYRDGQYKGAVSFLNRSIEAQKGKGSAFEWVFLAMAHHHLKQAADARNALQRANDLAKDVSKSWELQVEIRALLEEARFELSLPAM